MEIRIILAEDRDSRAALATCADQLWAHSTWQPHDAAINAVLDEEGQETPVLAAVSSSHHSRGSRWGRGRGGQGRPFLGRGGSGAPPASAAAADGNPNAPAKLARQIH
jgi:hypothetical protein